MLGKCVVCNENKEEVEKFLTYKGYVTLCIKCRPRAEEVRKMLKRSRS